MEVLRTDSGPPLFYLLEKPFLSIAERLSIPDQLLRFPSLAATLGLAAGALSLPAGRSRRLFLLLSASAPLLLVYAAEARAYAVLALLDFLLFLLARRKPTTAWGDAAIVLVTALALDTHYLAIFFVGAIATTAILERRWRLVGAVSFGTVLFLPWVPVLLAQPKAATAWMREPATRSASGFLSALGGAGRIPTPLGGPLPELLVWLGVAAACLLLVTLRSPLTNQPEIRSAVLPVVLTLGSALLASTVRPLAFAGRSELAILPVWLWALSRAAEKSRAAHWGAWLVAILGITSSVFLLAAPRSAPPAQRLVETVGRFAQKGDLVVASADLYLPARLASDRGSVACPVAALPSSLAAHPGWFLPEGPSLQDWDTLSRELAGMSARRQVFLILAPWFPTSRLLAILRSSGSLQEISDPAQATLLIWRPWPR